MFSKQYKEGAQVILGKVAAAELFTMIADQLPRLFINCANLLFGHVSISMPLTCGFQPSI